MGLFSHGSRYLSIQVFFQAEAAAQKGEVFHKGDLLGGNQRKAQALQQPAGGEVVPAVKTAAPWEAKYSSKAVTLSQA